MLFALCLLFARLIGDGISLAAASAPLSALFTLPALQSAALFATCAVLADQAAARLPRGPGKALLLAFVLFSLVLALIDGTALRYLREDALHSAGDLLSQYTTAGDIWVYAKQYVGLPLLVFSLIAHGGIALFSGWRRPRPARWAGQAAVLGIVQVAGWFGPAALDAGLGRLGGDQAGFSQAYVFRYRTLAATTHRLPVPRPLLLRHPATVVLFINESTPRQFPDSAGRRGELMRGIIRRAPAEAGPWIAFPKARTNASMTDISVPSLLTGVDPIEGADKLEAMPFVFDLARAAGYRTAFFTAQDYTVNGFHEFYSAARIGTYLTGDHLGLPKVNESGVDDMVVADRVARFFREARPGEPLFVVVNTNALHLPLQQTSEIPIPALPTREQRAAYVLEQYYRSVLGALEQTGRLAASLVIVTSDHGESDPLRPRSVARQRDHYEEVTNIPFFVHLPKGSPAELYARLRQNAAGNIANIDIAPTLADCFGFGPPEGLAYAGTSLFQQVPPDRLTDSVTTCEWRRWSFSAFGLARGEERLVFIEGERPGWFDLARDPQELHPVFSGEQVDSYLRWAGGVPTLEEILLHR